MSRKRKKTSSHRKSRIPCVKPSRSYKVSENEPLLANTLLTFFKVLVLVLLLGAVFFFIRLVRVYSIKLDNPLKGSSRVVLNKYDDIRKVLFVIQNSKDSISGAYMVVTNNRSHRSMVFHIPSDVYIDDYTGKLDTIISIGDLGYTGNLVEKSKWHEYIIWQVQSALALRLDSYVFINEEGFKMLSSSKDGLGGNPESQFKRLLEVFSYKEALINYSQCEAFYQEGLLSNMNIPEIQAFAREISQYDEASEENMIFVDIGEPKYLADDTLEAGKLVKKIKLNEIDSVTKDNLDIIRTKDIVKEQVKVEVYNGSGISKVAGLYSRMIFNSGCQVLRYGNAPDVVPETVIYISDPELYDHSLKIVQGMFIISPEVIVGRPDFMTTGDIVVVLGEDIDEERFE